MSKGILNGFIYYCRRLGPGLVEPGGIAPGQAPAPHVLQSIILGISDLLLNEHSIYVNLEASLRPHWNISRFDGKRDVIWIRVIAKVNLDRICSAWIKWIKRGHNVSFATNIRIFND